jgi:hypothetical protein
VEWWVMKQKGMWCRGTGRNKVNKRNINELNRVEEGEYQSEGIMMSKVYEASEIEKLKKVEEKRNIQILTICLDKI